MMDSYAGLEHALLGPSRHPSPQYFHWHFFPANCGLNTCAQGYNDKAGHICTITISHKAVACWRLYTVYYIYLYINAFFYTKTLQDLVKSKVSHFPEWSHLEGSSQLMCHVCGDCYAFSVATPTHKARDQSERGDMQTQNICYIFKPVIHYLKLCSPEF